MQTIRELRCGCGLTQTQLATRVGVRQTQISEWERGKYTPRPIHVFKLAQVFGVRMDDIELVERQTTATGAPNQIAPATSDGPQQSEEDSDDPNR